MRRDELGVGVDVLDFVLVFVFLQGLSVGEVERFDICLETESRKIRALLVQTVVYSMTMKLIQLSNKLRVLFT